MASVDPDLVRSRMAYDEGGGMTERSAIVVGGGIVGLTTAIGLTRCGWRVRLFERASGFAEVGAGISLWSNGLRALDLLGVGDRVRALGVVERSGGIRHRSGRWLARADLAELARRFGPVLMLHRADLLQALVDAVPRDVLEPGNEVHTVEPDAAGVTVGHSGGQARAEVVIAADGVRSAVRRLCWPDAAAPRYAGYTAWRFVTHGRAGSDELAAESWGRGARFGRAALPDGRVYCYATASVPAGTTFPDDLGELRRRFAGWHAPIPTLLDAAEPAGVLRHDVYDLPPLRSFVRDRVVLVGDAAHAMTPDLGQGACQGLEDAATLVSLLSSAPDLPAALDRYDAARRARTQAVARLSRRVGRIGQVSSRPAVRARDLLFRLIPPALSVRSLAPVLTWTPPAR